MSPHLTGTTVGNAMASPPPPSTLNPTLSVVLILEFLGRGYNSLLITPAMHEGALARCLAPGLQVEPICSHHPEAVDTLVDMRNVRPIGLESGGVAEARADEVAGEHGVPYVMNLEMKLINHMWRDVVPALVVAGRIAVHCESLVPSRQLVQDVDPTIPTNSQVRFRLPGQAAGINHL
jgi:hypothetical protein